MSHTTTKLAIGYAEWNEQEAAQLRAHNAHSPLMPELADMHAETAQTLRTLVAENDDLRAEVAECRETWQRIGRLAERMTEKVRSLDAERTALRIERDQAVQLAERHMTEKHKAQNQAREDWDVLQDVIASLRVEVVTLKQAVEPTRWEAMEEAAGIAIKMRDAWRENGQNTGLAYAEAIAAALRRASQGVIQ